MNLLQERLRGNCGGKKITIISGNKKKTFRPHNIYVDENKLTMQGEGLSVHVTTEITIGETKKFVEISPNNFEYDGVKIIIGKI